MTETENEIRAKELMCSKIQEQINNIKKVGVNQQRAMSDLNKEADFTQKLRALHDEQRRVKQSIRDLAELQKETERVNQEQHLLLLALEDRSRRYTNAVKRLSGVST